MSVIVVNTYKKINNFALTNAGEITTKAKTMNKKQQSIIILHDKLEKDPLKKNAYYRDMISVQRQGLKHKGKFIKANTLEKIISKDGVFENDRYVVLKGELIKNKTQLFCDKINEK